MSFKSLKAIINRLSLLALLVFSGAAFAKEPLAKYDFPTPVTPIGKTALEQHHLTFWICVGIAVLVFGAMIISLFLHRKSRGVTPATFHESTTLEVLWTIVPFAILIGLAVYATKSLIAYEDTSGSEMTIKIRAKQWYWIYEYPDSNKDKLAKEGVVKFESRLLKSHRDAALWQVDPSIKKPAVTDVTKIPNYLQEVDNKLVVPIKTKIRFLLTADKVIHAWWVPKFGLKKDAIPGYANTVQAYIETPGIYRGECAELCGREHSMMPVVVHAMTKKAYADWIAKQRVKYAKLRAEAKRLGATKMSKEQLMARGKKVYAQCAGCHGSEGQGVGTTFPALKGSKIANGPAAEHIKVVVHGVKGTAMSPYKHLNDVDLAAVITYERNAWGNKGSIVQPADVKKAR